jgi:soluble lytic murein transglycosylase
MSRIVPCQRLLFFLCLVLALARCGHDEGDHRPRGLSWTSEQLEQLAHTGTHDDANQLFRMGEVPTALRVLERIQQQDPAGTAGDEARLTIATILMSQRRYTQTVPLLDQVVKNGAVAPDYAQALLVEAIVEGEIGERLGSAMAIAVAQVKRRGELQSPLLGERFAALLVKAAAAAKDQSRVYTAGVQYLHEWPSTPRSDEVRWLTARALDHLGKVAEAGNLYAEIWFQTPESPWAKQARERLRASPRRGTEFRPMTSAGRLAFVARLQKVGLHEEALDELQDAGSGDTREDRLRVLAMSADSLFALRKNRECVQTAARLRSLAPDSTEAAAAGLLAIQALRRTDDLEAIREWTAWLARSFPDSATAAEARYSLATFLQNSDRRDEAIPLLVSVSRTQAQGIADNALWKLAWAYRMEGRNDEARAALERMLTEFPESGFRKAALYWLARFTENQDRAAAVRLYRTLLREYPQDYYGHEATRNLLALQEVVEWSDFGDQKREFPAIDPLDDPTLRPAADAYARAVSLTKIGLFSFAADELESLPDVERDPSLAFALADVRTRSGDTWSGVEILKHSFADFLVSGSRDTRVVPEAFWYIAYPYNYRSLIEDAVREAGLDSAQIEPALVASLIRMESRFLPSAVSSVGAVGLMQLMPGTAEELARKVTGASVTRAELFEPEINIRYGTRYLADRVRDFRGEWFPAICSYNAGVRPVRRWWEARRLEMPMDEFIESIPFEATRLYVKQVLGDYRNYQWIYYQGHRGNQ